MEGSTVVPLARPDRLVFVAHPFLSPARWKPTSDALVAAADVVVVNRPAGDAREPSPDVRRRLGRPHVVADVTAPAPAWAGPVLVGLQPAAMAAIGDTG
jgi:hypothetical protein